jgi:hypothetical protein
MPILTYFIRAGGDGSPVKIGVSSNVGSRLASLQTACPHELEVLFILGGNHEKAFHKYLHRFRMKGEWFNGCPAFVSDLLAGIARMERQGVERWSLRGKPSVKLLPPVYSRKATVPESGQERERGLAFEERRAPRSPVGVSLRPIVTRGQIHEVDGYRTATPRRG